MKNLKSLLVVVLIIVISALIGLYVQPDNPLLITLIVLIVGLATFNLIVRNSPAFKPYFTSRFNLFTSKVKSENVYDIPIDLMFEKIIEVINHSKFRLIEADNESFEIMANTTMTFRSWGENIYINFEETEGNTKMKFCSATLFQIHSWGKNEENYHELLNRIENSLIV